MGAPAGDASADDADPAGGEVRVAALIAERDARRAGLEATTRERGASRLRRIASPVLVVVFAVSLLASGVGVWLHRSTLDGEVWAERVGTLGQDPAVQQALATWTTDQLMGLVEPGAFFEEILPERGRILAVPLSSAVRSWIGDRVDEFFASERFERLWAAAATRAHDEAVALLRDEVPAVEAGGGTVVINLIPIVDAALKTVLDAAPGLVGSDVRLPDVSVTDLPAAARQRLADALGVTLDADFGTITVYDGGRLSTAQRAVKLFDRFVALAVVLTVASAAAALVLATNRRRTSFQLLGAAALVAVLVRRVVILFQQDVADLVPPGENRAAAAAVLDALIGPFTGAAANVLGAAVALGFVLAVTGPYAWAARLRSMVRDAARPIGTAVSAGAEEVASATWVREHVDVLRTAGWVVGGLLLWWIELSWLSLAAVGALVALWQALLARVRRASARLT